MSEIKCLINLKNKSSPLKPILFFNVLIFNVVLFFHYLRQHKSATCFNQKKNDLCSFFFLCLNLDVISNSRIIINRVCSTEVTWTLQGSNLSVSACLVSMNWVVCLSFIRGLWANRGEKSKKKEKALFLLHCGWINISWKWSIFSYSY